MDDKYNVFSTFYRELIDSSGHLKNERNTINQIVDEVCPNKESKILDVACGTGDALFELYNQGYKNISGLDSSIKMINRAKELLPNIDFYHSKWESLSHFSLNQQYDFLFAISISLPHALQKDFPQIFQSFYSMLSKNGVLVFDNRVWHNENQSIIEKDRPVCIFSNPRKFKIENESWVIDDMCEYTNDRQIITYRISKENSTDKHIQYIEVDYAKVFTSDYIEMLYTIGFKNVFSKRIKDWSYELIYALK